MQRNVIALCLIATLTACGLGDKPAETADEFAARANTELQKSGHEGSMAAWVQPVTWCSVRGSDR